MLKSREGQSVALAAVMLVIWTAAAINVNSRPQTEEAASRQMDVLPLMSHARNLPVQATPIWP